MLIIKPAPVWFDSYNVLITLMIFWWFCRLCSTMKTLCDSDLCECNHQTDNISCTCQNSDQKLEITNEGINRIMPSMITVNVKNCNFVRIKTRSFYHLKNLVRINILNVRNLTLEEHSFSWNDTAIYDTYSYNGIEITIENSTVTLPSYVFRGRIDSMMFKNTRFENIEPYAFSSLAGTKTITFKNCDFINVADQAFKRFTLDKFNIIGGHVSSILPSRTMTNISVKTEFQLNGVIFDRIRSSAFHIHGPYSFHIQNCYIGHLEGEAFLAKTRGPVFVDDNIIYSMEEGALLGIGIEKHTLEQSGHQEFIFENNTITEVERAALLFDISGFLPKLDWIYFNTRCDCESINHWLSDVVIYSHSYPKEIIKPNINLQEIMSCKNTGQYIRLKDYSTGYCEEQAQTAQILICAGILTILLLVLFIVFYFYLHRNRQSRWINVPQSSPVHESIDTLQNQSPRYEEPSTSRNMILPDRRTYKETELQVIVECTEPLQEYNSRVERHYEPVDYRSRRYGRQNLLTSDL